MTRKVIVGVDEVGRGAWAGPLVVGAVILSDANVIKNLKDSKVLSKSRRQTLSQIIHDQAVGVGLGWVTSIEVDDLGLTKATTLAINRAIEKLPEYDEIIIDGHINYLAENVKARCLIDADALLPCVSAASIAAKVARDDYMADLDKKYPGYGFDSNVGYGTAKHRQAIDELGLCPEHRLSFKPLQKVLQP